MNAPGPTTVFVADDHPMVRESLVRAIARAASLQVVGEAQDGRATLEALRDLRPDVALVDVRMPGLDGMAVLNAVRRDRLPTRIMLLSGVLERHDVDRALELGAAALLSKTIEAPALVEAVLAVRRGETVLSPDVPQPTAAGDHAVVARALTAREHEILQLMAAGRSGPQIAGDLVLSPSTIKTHVEKLYAKLGVSDRGAAVAIGIRRGLID